MLVSAEARLTQARAIADSCRGRAQLHEVLMRSVFLMEDIVFMLHEMAALQQKPEDRPARSVLSGTPWRAGPSLTDDRR